MKKKFYAIRNGLKIGVFTEWSECQKYIKGFSGAVFKSFATEMEAMDYLNNATTPPKNPLKKNQGLCAYVDGSFSAKKQIYSYGCVMILDNEKIYETSGISSKYIEMRNVAGEILSAKKAIQWAMDNGFKELTIYHDYEGIGHWADGSWKAAKDGTKEYTAFTQSVKDKIHLQFVKVAAHTGDKFNEEADKLAAYAINPETAPEGNT